MDPTLYAGLTEVHFVVELFNRSRRLVSVQGVCVGDPCPQNQDSLRRGRRMVGSFFPLRASLSRFS